HRNAGYKLGRPTQHRWALFRNLLVALFRHERITTTDTKARAVRGLAEHMITLAKRENLHARRQVLSMVPDTEVVGRLFDTISAHSTRAMSERSGVSVASPGPRGYPLLGVVPSAREDPLGFFRESARTHGDVVALPFGMRRLYLLSHPDHIKYVLQEHDGLFQKGPAAARIKPLFGESLTTVDGDDWRRRRRLLRPAFQPQRLVAAVPTIAAMAEEMLGRWRSPLEHGRPLGVFAERIGVTRAIILRILFGDVSEVDAWTVGQAFTTTAERVNRELWSPLGWLFRLLPSSARYDRAERCLDEFMTRRIDEARRRGPGRDLLSTMLAARDEETDGRFDDAALADELKALFVAGHTTTASGLAWVWYVLSQNSRARRRLQNEVRAVLGTRPPTADDLPALD